jgi:hypothetical protein
VNVQKRLALSALGVTLAGAVVAGIGWAAIPGADGVINGCYEKRTGILRVIDKEAGKSCLSFETPITWNQKGPAGAQGPAGAPGPAGPKGDQGLAGPEGPNGEPGAQGPAGEDGAVGPEGTAGPAGPAGAPGSPGLQGPAGAKGDPGDAGLTWRGAWNAQLNYLAGDMVAYEGSSWVAIPASAGGTTAGYAPPDNLNEWNLVADKGGAGADGPQGPAGPEGPAGPQGAAGPPGPIGQTGPAGPAGGLAGYEVVLTNAVTVPGLQSKEADATCPAGKSAIGGGHFATAFHLEVLSNAPLQWYQAPSVPVGSGWRVKVYNPHVFNVDFRVTAVCANA